MTYREAREKAGLSLNDASERIGVTRVALWMWESGKGNPLLSNLMKMSEVYGVPVGKLDIVAVPPLKQKKEEADG